MRNNIRRYRVSAVTVPATVLLMIMPSWRISAKESQDLGSELGRAWIAEPATRPAAVLVCLHGIQTNRDWWRPLGHELAASGIALWAFNRPGSGNPAPPGPAALSTLEWPQQMNVVRDAASKKYGDIPLLAAGVSWGASVAILAAERYPNTWSGAILLNPAFKTARDAAFRRNTLNHFWPWHWWKPISLPLSPTDYTNSEQTWSRYLQPNQLKNSATFSFLRQTSRARKAAIAALNAPARPTLVLLGQADALAAPHLFYEATRLAPGTTGNRTVEVVSKATHAAIVEPENKIIAIRIVSWVTQRLPDARKESR